MGEAVRGLVSGKVQKETDHFVTVGCAGRFFFIGFLVSVGGALLSWALGKCLLVEK